MSTTESRVPRSRSIITKPDGTERVIPSKILTALCKKSEYAHLETALKALPELVTIVFRHGDLGGRRRAIQIKNTPITFNLADFNNILSGCKYFLVNDDDPESFALEADIVDATITERKCGRGGEIASIYTLERGGSTYTLKARHSVMHAAAALETRRGGPDSTSMTTTHGEEPARKRRRQTTPELSSQQETSNPAELPSLSSVLSFIGEKPNRPDLPFSSTVPPAITVTPVTPIPESLRRVLNP